MAPNKLFGSLFARIFTADAPHDEKPALQAEQRLQSALDQMEDRIRELQLLGDGPEARQAARAADPARDVARLGMLDDIQAQHVRLHTDIEPAEMWHLRHILEGHAPSLQPGPRATIEQQIEAFVLDDILHRTAQMAWDRLEILMTRASQAWPTPEDLLRGREPHDRQHVQDQHRAEVRAGFLEASIERVAALICGEVPSWSHYYPAPGSTLWQEAVLRGVASALQAQLFTQALELWVWKPRTLDRDIDDLLAPHVDQVQSFLQGGVTSVDAARRVSQEVTEACRVVIPARVWEVIGPQLSWSRADRTAVLQAIDRGELVEDPVCRMAMSPDRVAQTMAMRGRVWPFCSRPCRERFESDPERFMAGYQVTTGRP